MRRSWASRDSLDARVVAVVRSDQRSSGRLVGELELPRIVGPRGRGEGRTPAFGACARVLDQLHRDRRCVGEREWRCQPRSPSSTRRKAWSNGGCSVSALAAVGNARASPASARTSQRAAHQRRRRSHRCSCPASSLPPCLESIARDRAEKCLTWPRERCSTLVCRCLPSLGRVSRTGDGSPGRTQGLLRDYRGLLEKAA